MTREFWRYVMVQERVAQLALTAIEYATNRATGSISVSGTIVAAAVDR
jgi:hypothetical protein